VAAGDDATKYWIRLQPNMGLGAYEVLRAKNTLSEPAWPDLPFKELLRIAFHDSDRYVDRIDHPIIQRLHGLR
jgi:hypothetical protein